MFDASSATPKCLLRIVGFMRRYAMGITQSRRAHRRMLMRALNLCKFVLSTWNRKFDPGQDTFGPHLLKLTFDIFGVTSGAKAHNLII